MKPKFFATQVAFRAWLEKHHATETELLVGLYRAKAKDQGLSYKPAVDEALCFGWIDGVRKTIDDERWAIRFTPRKKGSIWSNVNVKRMEELLSEGRVAPAGKRAYEAKLAHKTGIYAFEKAPAVFESSMERAFKKEKKAWAFFTAQAPWYQRHATSWVTSAKKEETRAERFATLVADSAAGRLLERVAKYRKKG